MKRVSASHTNGHGRRLFLKIALLAPLASVLFSRSAWAVTLTPGKSGPNEYEAIGKNAADFRIKVHRAEHPPGTPLTGNRELRVTRKKGTPNPFIRKIKLDSKGNGDSGSINIDPSDVRSVVVI